MRTVDSGSLKCMLTAQLLKLSVEILKAYTGKLELGEIENFTGVSHPYEVPIEPDIHLHTENSTI